MMRDWSTFYELHEQDSTVNVLLGGDLSTRTRYNTNLQLEAGVIDNGILKVS